MRPGAIPYGTEQDKRAYELLVEGLLTQLMIQEQTNLSAGRVTYIWQTKVPLKLKSVNGKRYDHYKSYMRQRQFQAKQMSFNLRPPQAPAQDPVKSRYEKLGLLSSALPNLKDAQLDQLITLLTTPS